MRTARGGSARAMGAFRDVQVDRLKTLWPEIDALLDQLLELDEPERSRLIDRAFADSPEKRRAVEALLRADHESGGLIETPLPLPDLAGDVAPSESSDVVNARIGPYVVRREIARGGMGTVLLAERDDGQFAQQVAIKLIRSDVLTPGARERFLLERRILAGLQNSHVARLLDGGVREDGSPYLVMEYVDGKPITTWCDERRLDLRARVELFLQVCDAVEFAHRQLVVHRDLKPDNILVTDSGEAKLLDFGIAKLLEAGVEVAMTGTQARVFTPAYATPEQYLGGTVTVASDEYQLALVLYEMLTGRRAHGDAAHSPLQHQRAVLETDPERPSRRVTRGSAATPAAPSKVDPPTDHALAGARATTVPALARSLAGDLDAIVLKALEREPAHRYPTVEAFRRDLEAWLADRPVSARRATSGYRVRKFARRHRVALTTSAVVLVTLASGVAGVLIQARAAARDRDLARESERKATAINDFVLRELLESPTPERALGRSLSVAEVLANATRTVGHAFPGEPGIEAAVRLTLARSYQALGRLDPSREQAEAALELLSTRSPDAHERMDARALLAELALDQGKAKEAQGDFEKLLADQEKALGPGDPATIRSRGQVGQALAAQGHWSRADTALSAALAAMPAPGDTPWQLAVDLRSWIAGVWISQGRTAEAESLIQECLAIERRHLGPDHPQVAASLRLLAVALGRDLRAEEAGRALADVLKMTVRLYGEDHPATGDAYASLAVNFDSRLMRDSSLAAAIEAARIYRQALGADHPKTLRMMRNQAIDLRRARRFREADQVYTEVYRSCARTLGRDHWQTIEALKGLSYLRLDEGRTEEGRDLARQVIASYERIAADPDADPARLTEYAIYLVEAEPPDVRDPQRAVAVARRAVDATQHGDYLALRALGFAQDAAGNPEAAIASLREALSLPDGVRSWTTEDKLVEVLARHRTAAELERVLLGRIEDLRRLRGPDDRYIAKTERHLSRLYQRQGRDDDAERMARESLGQLRKTLAENHWEVGRAKADLGALLVARRAYAEAESLLVQGFRILDADPDILSSVIENVRSSLVRLYEGAGRPAEARAWRARIISGHPATPPL